MIAENQNRNRMGSSSKETEFCTRGNAASGPKFLAGGVQRGTKEEGAARNCAIPQGYHTLVTAQYTERHPAWGRPVLARSLRMTGRSKW